VAKWLKRAREEGFEKAWLLKESTHKKRLKMMPIVLVEGRCVNAHYKGVRLPNLSFNF